MNIVQYINRQQINPVEVGAFDKAATTLQQGHKEAVKAASDLELAIAKLDLNEQEDEFKARKLNEIRETIAQNTIYGNSYGALSKIIAAQGSILGGADMMGRLKAQAEYKQYQSELSKRNDISQDVKDRFREMNPYYYQDKFDKKTGEIVGGTAWKPTSSPVEGVDLSKVAAAALQFAAREKGGGNRTTWLDANGNPTTDYRKSVTGAVFNVTTQQWERLSEEKIRQGIQAAMGLVKGAKDSAMQDYETALWKYNKLRKENKSYAGTDDIIDEHGQVRSFEGYLDHLFMPMIKASSYNNVVTSTDYKDGYEKQLAYYKSMADAAAKAAAAANGRDPSDLGGNNSNPNAGNSGTIDVESNPYPEVYANELRTNNYLLSTIKGLAKNVKGFDWLKDVNSFHDIYSHYNAGPHTTITKLKNELAAAGVNINKDTQLALYNNATGYYSYNQQRRHMDSGLKQDDTKIVQSSRSLMSDHFKKGNNDTEDAIVDKLNYMNMNTDSTVVTLRKEVVDALNNIKANYLNESGFKVIRDGESYKVTIPKKDYNKAVRFFGDVDRADTASSNKGFWNTIGGIGRSTLGLLQHEGGNYSIDYYKKGENVTLNSSKAFGSIGSKYNSLVEQYQDVTKNRMPNVKSTGRVNVSHIGTTTFTQSALQDAYNNGMITANDYNAKVKMANDALVNHLSGGDIKSGLIYNADEHNHFTKSTNPETVSAFINYAMKNFRDKVTISAGEIPIGTSVKGRSLPTSGYFISVSLPNNSAFGNFAAGKTYKFFYGNGFVEGQNLYNPSTNTSSLARTAVQLSHAKQSVVNNMITDLSYLGEASIKPTNDGGFNCRFGSFGKGRSVSSETAEMFAKSCYMLDQLYDSGNQSLAYAQQRNPEMFSRTISGIVQSISAATGGDTHTITTMVMNYLNKAE